MRILLRVAEVQFCKSKIAVLQLFLVHSSASLGEDKQLQSNISLEVADPEKMLLQIRGCEFCGATFFKVSELKLRTPVISFNCVMIYEYQLKSISSLKRKELSRGKAGKRVEY